MTAASNGIRGHRPHNWSRWTVGGSRVCVRPGCSATVAEDGVVHPKGKALLEFLTKERPKRGIRLTSEPKA